MDIRHHAGTGTLAWLGITNDRRPHVGNHVRSTGAILVLLAVSALPLTATAGSVTYSPTADTTQAVAQGGVSLPFTFKAESPRLPSTGKPKMTPYETQQCDDSLPGIEAQYLVKDMSYTYTDPSTLELVTVPFDFSGWITLDPGSECFDGPRLGNTVSATVNVPNGAGLGMYTAKLVAKGPNGIGWGEGSGVHITVNVIEPTATDSTPPVVTIGEPALDGENPQGFVLGDRIPINFTAVDPESPVSGWTTTLNQGNIDVSDLLTEAAVTDGIEANGYILTAVPGGTETIQAIGQYSLQATATSEGGTSAPTSRLFTVNYDVNPMAPDLTDGNLTIHKNFNSQNKCTGGGLQVKFEAKAVQPADTSIQDNSAEAFVRDESVFVDLVNNSDDSLLMERTYGTDNSTQVTITGQTGDTSGQYFTKVDLCSAPVGAYTIYVYFDDYLGTGYLQYSKTFTLQD